MFTVIDSLLDLSPAPPPNARGRSQREGQARAYRLHAVCQSAIVLLNLAVIALAMFPSFHHQVSPQLPGKIGKPYYALASAHAALGVIAEIGGLYILLAAGTSLLPRRLRLTRYKFWMRIVLAAWWLVLLLGLATYARWYVPLR